MDRVEIVVVIGDGPSPEGMKWGSSIDSNNIIVVRLWNHEWQGIEDYGTRYDYGLINSLDDARRAFRKPAVSWFFYNGKGEPEVPSICEKAIIPLNHRALLERAKAEGAMPATAADALKLSRGFVVAVCVIEMFRPRLLVLLGFDNLRAGATTSPRYGKAAAAYREMLYPGVPHEELPPGSTREGPHDLAVESLLARKLAAEAGTEIAWGF